MNLFPAIDILNGRAVRLLHGKIDEVTDYGDPISRSLMWKEQGATFLHVVDLQGAFFGKETSDEIIKNIVLKSKLKVQSGGGLRTLYDVEKRLDLGVERVILGTMSVENPTLTRQIIEKFGNKIVIGIDAKDNIVMTKGWVKSSGLDAVEFALSVKKEGVDTIVYTDISRDGDLSGVNVEATKIMSEKSGLNVIASGGVSNLNDIKSLSKNKIYGAILGRAIYTGDIELEKAFEVVKNAL